MRRRALAAALIATGGLTALGAPGIVEPAAAVGQGNLALEPIGGFTDLGDVRVITTALCPAQSTNLMIRISGGGFRPDSNVIGNSQIAGQLMTPDRTGYVVPIFADWEYLAESHEARTPLNGPAELTLLCADADLERIDARMAGRLRFESRSGEKSKYLQDGGPRIATGIPGIPPPGSGGVPRNAPTTPPVTNAAGQLLEAPAPADAAGTAPAADSGASQAASAPGTAKAKAKPGVGATRSLDAQPTAARGSSPVTLLALAATAALLGWALLIFVRRPRGHDPEIF